MIRINQLKLPISHTREQLEQKICKMLKIRPTQLKEYRIAKKSIDARKKPELFFVYAVDAFVTDEEKILKKVDNNNIMLTKDKIYRLPECKPCHLSNRPIIAGMGPAGLFCAYALVQSGQRPIV
ncbi:MAG: FAD-dependent oxidoreductase, partial [Clostridiales bacterium]|nr:FAD-dependent oxidoreductase [Clostridiales bacterium]